MKFFDNKKSAPVVATSAAATIPANHVSKKKKNTYQVQLSILMPGYLFELCKHTPLGVITLNGKKVQNKDGWLRCTEFPNPCASDMIKKHDTLREIMGKKMATQIIEYLDKDTGAPVVQIYPESMWVFDEFTDNYMSRLNHATRQDLKKQIALREKLINEFMSQQKQK